MSDLGRVMLLAGGLSHERDVSIRSGRRVADALRRVDEVVDIRDLDAELVPELASDPPDVVFPLVHGAQGEDGAIRDVLELLGIPYVGAPPNACRMTFDKPVAKYVVERAGVSTPPSVALPHETFRELGAAAVLHAVVDRLGLPLVVKPTRGGSALGCSIVHDLSDLPSAMVNCFAYGDVALIEQYVAGIEVAISVVDPDGGKPQALPAVEIVPSRDGYDFEARYTAGTTEFFVPARLEPVVAAAAEEAALLVHRSLGLRDLSRTDLIIDGSGRPWFLEANVAPGMTETSLLPQSVAAANIDLGEFCRELCRIATFRGVATSGR